MYEVIFKIRHRSCPFNMISVKYPNAVISSWCNERVDVFDVKGKTEDVIGVLEDIKRLVHAVGGKVKHRSYDGTTGRVLAVSWGKNCTCHRIMKNAKAIEIDRLIQRHYCVNIHPTVYRSGLEQYRIMAFEGEQIKNLFKSLDKVGDNEMVLKRRLDGEIALDVFTVSLSGLLSGLTEKQLQALVEALDVGYYKVPRAVTVAELSESIEVPRTTFEEHLRKGESKVLLALLPYLKMYYEGINNA